jgi:hypothetical protein
VEISGKTIENWRDHRRKSAKDHTIRKIKVEGTFKDCASCDSFLCPDNITFRGRNEVIGHQQTDFFLNLIELISHYNPLLKQHIETHEKGSVHYLSPSVQNEFIALLANQVLSEMITRVKNAKYYSLMFDCTPDSSHKEQMSDILRYVYITEGRVTIQQRFVDFISTHEKPGLELSNEILNKIKQDELDIKKARGQSYDNGVNMAGIYN